MPRPFEKILISLGLTRVLCGILILVIYNRESIIVSYYTLSLVVIGQTTDHIDGYIARRFSFPSATGYIQDSLADKLFQFSILVAVTREYSLSLIIIWVVFCREIILLSLRIIRVPTDHSLKRLKIYSISYALLLRGALVILISSPVLSSFDFLERIPAQEIGVIMLLLSSVPALLGIIAATRSILK